MNEQEVSVADTPKGEMIANPQDDEGEELLFLKTTRRRNEDENQQQKNISIKVITLVEKDKVPIKVEDTSDEKDQSTEEDREIEPQKTTSTVTLRPKETEEDSST